MDVAGDKMDVTGSKADVEGGGIIGKTGPISLVEISLLLVSMTLLFDNNWNSYTIVLFCIVAFFSSPLREKAARLKVNFLSWLLPVAYFGWIALNYAFDRDSSKSTSLLERNGSLLALPVMLGSIGVLRRESLKRIMLGFVLSNIAGSLYCLYKAYQAYLAYVDTPGQNRIELLFYHKLAHHININAIYFSMYCLFSVIILVYYYFLGKASFRSRLLAGLGTAYLVLFLFLLASKMFIFLLCLTGVGIIVYVCIYYRQLVWGIVAVIVFLGGMVFLLNRFSFAKKRVESTQLKKYSGMEDNFNGMAVRGIFWQTTWDLIKKDPSLLGMGHFTAQDSLQKGYVKVGFSDGGANEEYNSHNQYLYTWLCYGYIGLLTLLTFFFRYFWLACREKTFLGVALTLLFILANITECMLEAQKGLVFFLFFAGLILFNSLSSGSSKTTPARQQGV